MQLLTTEREKNHSETPTKASSSLSRPGEYVASQNENFFFDWSCVDCFGFVVVFLFVASFYLGEKRWVRPSLDILDRTNSKSTRFAQNTRFFSSVSVSFCFASDFLQLNFLFAHTNYSCKNHWRTHFYTGKIQRKLNNYIHIMPFYTSQCVRTLSTNKQKHWKRNEELDIIYFI